MIQRNAWAPRWNEEVPSSLTETGVLIRMAKKNTKWPTTVEEAADRILAQIVRGTKREDPGLFHHGWGTGIRNAFGLWKGNQALLESSSSGSWHPDDYSRLDRDVYETQVSGTGARRAGC